MQKYGIQRSSICLCSNTNSMPSLKAFPVKQSITILYIQRWLYATNVEMINSFPITQISFIYCWLLCNIYLLVMCVLINENNVLCFCLKINKMLYFRDLPVNIEVTGYVISKIFFHKDVMPWNGKQQLIFCAENKQL